MASYVQEIAAIDRRLDHMLDPADRVPVVLVGSWGAPIGLVWLPRVLLDPAVEREEGAYFLDVGRLTGVTTRCPRCGQRERFQRADGSAWCGHRHHLRTKE